VREKSKDSGNQSTPIAAEGTKNTYGKNSTQQVTGTHPVKKRKRSWGVGREKGRTTGIKTSQENKQSWPRLSGSLDHVKTR